MEKINIFLIKMWIDDNIICGINCEDVVNFSGYSRTYLLTQFKIKMGISVSCYIRTKRLQLASEMLINTNLRIKEISQIIGYLNQNAFCQEFKYHLNMSPIKFRYHKMLRCT